MKITLIIQCIDTFGFSPAEDRLRFYADGRLISPIRKGGGFYIVTRELPNKFTLSIISDVYYCFRYSADVEKGIIRANLIRRFPPPRRAAVWSDVQSYGKTALEYGYFYLASRIKKGDNHITAENPYRFCLEGRSFLLSDTISGAEEFIVLEKAENAAMTDYFTGEIKNDYSAENSVLLPAFDLYVSGKIPLEKPTSGTAAIRIYGGNTDNFKRISVN